MLFCLPTSAENTALAKGLTTPHDIGFTCYCFNVYVVAPHD